MTGFGSSEGKVGSLRVSVELRTVNHRFFNPSIKLPAAFSKWEGDVREILRQRIARGHAALTARVDRDSTPAGGINEARFAEYVAVLRGLQERHGLTGGLDAATVLSLPDVVNLVSHEGDDGSVDELLAVVERAVASLLAMRSEEGARLAGFLLERINLVAASVDRIAERAPIRLAEHGTRLRKSVRELAGAANVDPQRLAQEVAILADRMDISEEIDRFKAHIDAFCNTLDETESDAVGKRLGFLLQEMVREANTMGSKAADAPILGEVVSIKEELERIREQVENVE
ncbi:MAG TPA: YicC/YloC family endoribonuclease [Gemmatimonadaceae bacterium]|nr:YicC/YloC family endoribonuclease [Gemmatimonadaceae bacterium]